MKYCCYFILVFLFIVRPVVSQQNDVPKKVLHALPLKDKITIDGRLDEDVWFTSEKSGDFYTFSPTYGKPSPFKTEVSILYDNDAVYIGAWLYDNAPDSMMKEVAVRDYSMTKSEVFLVWLCPYNDGQNLLQFEASIANVQKDGKVTNNVGDLSWNAIYVTGTHTDEKGWYVEMKIPFKSIYFPDKEIQEWGINFLRWVPRKGYNYSWAYFDRALADIGSQMGVLKGIKNVKQPLRLNLFPYVSGNMQKSPSGNSYAYSAGLDLQYGLNESFTLDMILIPDFGQRKSDYEVLNLTPFEVQYDENRQFFQTGFELYKNVDLFYSRRIGKKPSLYSSINDSANAYGGSVLNNPAESKLINAFNITGRTSDGLGLGFFNAITNNTYASITDSSGNEKVILTEAGKNYNMMAYDRVLGKYSYVNFINTNVYQPSNNKLANVFGSAYKFSDDRNAFMLYGRSSFSYVKNRNEANKLGYMTVVTGGKGSGNHVYLSTLGVYSDKFDPNDMGYVKRNNLSYHKHLYRFRQFNPRAHFVNWSTEASFTHRVVYNTFKYYNVDYLATFNGIFKNYYSVQLDLAGMPFVSKDPYEARTEGRIFKGEAYHGGSITGGTDTRKNIYGYIAYGLYKWSGTLHYFGLSSRMKLTDKFSITPSASLELSRGDIGYADKVNDDTIIIGYRDVNTLTIVMSSSYVFSNKHSLSLNVRQYWSALDYTRYCLLNEDGSWQDAPFYNSNKDQNFNTINVDLLYSWNFAPGSFFTLGWKNGIYLDDPVENNHFYSYFRNLNYVIVQPQSNMVSFKVTYYLDYIYLTKYLKGNDRT